MFSDGKRALNEVCWKQYKAMKKLGMRIKFPFSKGEYFREATMGFPLAADTVSAKLLVVAVDDEDKIVGACGIRSVLNVMGGLYVKEDYRGRGTAFRENITSR